MFKHLTNSYVEALGLKKVLVSSPTVECYFSEYAPKPETQLGFNEAVILDERVYVKAEDGLSWDLVE